MEKNRTDNNKAHISQIQDGQITIDTKLSHLDQHKMLRDEMLQSLRNINQTELWGAVGVGVVYSWLMTNRDKIQVYPLIWYIGPGVVLLCAARCLIETIHISLMAKYLSKIELVTFGSASHELPGWERYIAEQSQDRFFKFFHVTLAALLWLVGFALSVAASYYLSQPR